MRSTTPPASVSVEDDAGDDVDSDFADGNDDIETSDLEMSGPTTNNNNNTFVIEVSFILFYFIYEFIDLFSFFY